MLGGLGQGVQPVGGKEMEMRNSRVDFDLSPRAGAANRVELHKYEVKNRACAHFSLALRKNLMLKGRRPCGCCCEVCIPPGLLLLLLVGYSAANLNDKPAGNYMLHTPRNTTMDVVHGFCVADNSSVGGIDTLVNPVGYKACGLAVGTVCKMEAAQRKELVDTFCDMCLPDANLTAVREQVCSLTGSALCPDLATIKDFQKTACSPDVYEPACGHGGRFDFSTSELIRAGTRLATVAAPGGGNAYFCIGRPGSTGPLNIQNELWDLGNLTTGMAAATAGVADATSPRDIPRFDAMVAVQKATKLTVNVLDVDINVGGANGAVQMSGDLLFTMGPGVECSEVQALITHMRSRNMLFDAVYNESRQPDGCSGVWPSEGAAVDYAKDDGAGRTWGIVILNKVNWAENMFDYTLRLNHTGTPWTNRFKDRFSQGLGSKPHAQYVSSGFMTLQEAVYDYVGLKASAPQEYDIQAAPMPTANYTESEFFQRAGGLLPQVMVLAFNYPVSKCVSGLVLEKELRLREGMLIMGLSKKAFFSSHFVTYWILTTLSCIVMTLLSASSFLGSTAPLLLFTLYEVFAFSVVCFCMLVSVFFSKSRIAAIFAPLSFYITSVPAFAMSNDVALSTKRGMSLFSPVAFSYGAKLLCDYEGAGQGASFDDFWSDDYSFGTSVFFMLLASFIYLFLSFYLDNVMPSEFGVKQHPAFLFMPSYWCPKAAEAPAPSPKAKDSETRRTHEAVVETFDEATYEAMRPRERVRIMGLTKVFKTDDGRELTAVDGLGDGLPVGALKFYEGQIQCLLGHNGAGKTTLINMLTGMVGPTSGDCTVWGNSITTGMETIREDLGLCPQHNILWPEMSCLEHLEFFAKLKGVPSDRVLDLANQMLELVNLTQKKNAWSSVLSGGQKRKLSVAISLIGGARIVFLDEPTAGMDVESRRAMWHLLRRPEVLEGRVIVLCTHYMDEADLLGDSIAIMNKGRLHSWGSPFFLKTHLGVGYNLTFAMRAGCDAHAISDVVRGVCPGAKTLSTTGSELRIQVPMEGEIRVDVMQALAARSDIGPERATVLHKAAASADGPKRREAVAGLMRDASLSAEAREALAEALNGIRAERTFPDLFDSLDQRKDELKIGSYGVSVTTLEEVFMKIALEEGIDAREDAAEKQKEFKLYSLWDEGEMAKRITGSQLYVKQFGGLVLKRVHCARRDRRTLWCQYLLPVIFMTLALLIGRLGPPSLPSIVLDGEQFEQPTEVPYLAPAGGDLFTTANWPETMFTLIQPDNLNYSNSTAGVDLSTWLLANANKHNDDKYGGPERGIAYATPDTVAGGPNRGATCETLLVNDTFRPALAIALNCLHHAKLKRAGSKLELVARNHPLPWSDREKQTIESIQIIFTGIFILIPFTFIPSNFVSFIVKERECKAKHVQIVSGVSPLAYWTSSFVFDLLAYCGTLVLAFIVFFADSRDEYIGGGDVFFATFLLFFLYGASSICASYFWSFAFNTHSQAQTVVLIGNFITGFILVIGSQIMDLIDSTKGPNKVLKYFYRFIPSYCLGEGIIGLGLRQLISLFDDEQGPFDWDVTGASLCYMGLFTPVYFGLTLLLEDATIRAKVFGMWQKRPCQGPGQRRYNIGDLNQPMLDGADGLEEEEDEQVKEEREAVAGPEGREGDLVTVQNLRKVWPPTGNQTRPKVAVHNLSFGVKRGELFAFLGTNGAGKTTTMSVLSGEFLPTGGRALLGYDPQTGRKLNVVDDAQLARQSLGFCPQFDSLLDLMTPDEHLWLFARLRGIPVERVQESVELLLGKLGLTPHRGKKAKSLSGGNRRKLSVAVALMGGPPVIFLDEPSAGMDPVARRGLWGALESICQERSVVLTTHHLEEVEGLSHLPHRVSIIVDGKLQCIGTLQEVKSKFGDAYEMELKFRSPECAGAVKDFVIREFPRATLEESASQRLTYKLPKPITLGEVFRKIESSRHVGISEYSVNETSLEQVFMRISERALRDQELSPAPSPKSDAGGPDGRQRVYSGATGDAIPFGAPAREDRSYGGVGHTQDSPTTKAPLIDSTGGITATAL